MKLNGSNRDTEAIGNLFVYAITQEFFENFAFARTKRNGARQAATEAQKLFRTLRDAFNQTVISGNPHGVVLGQFSAGHAAQCQQARCAIYSRFTVTVQFDLEP